MPLCKYIECSLRRIILADDILDILRIIFELHQRTLINRALFCQLLFHLSCLLFHVIVLVVFIGLISQLSKLLEPRLRGMFWEVFCVFILEGIVIGLEFVHILLVCLF